MSDTAPSHTDTNRLEALDISQADYSNSKDREDILFLLDTYARDPMGLNRPLPEKVKRNLFSEWSKVSTAFSIIARMDGSPVGLVNAFFGFSTFKGAPLVNIHDIVVLPETRGEGVGNQLLQAVEEKAIANGCCKITLEVRDDNPARRLYQRFGFSDEEPPMRFWTKNL